MGKNNRKVNYASEKEIITIREFLWKYAKGPGYRGKLTHQILDQIMIAKGLTPIKRVASDSIKKEDICTGRVVWVIDENHHPAGYLNPYYKSSYHLMEIYKKAEIPKEETLAARLRILKEQGYMIDFDGEIISIENYEKRKREDIIIEQLESFLSRDNSSNKKKIYTKK